MNWTLEAIAQRIDHALLGPTLTDRELEAGCRLALEYQVASVCIKPYAVSQAAAILKGSGVKVGTTIGFPHGGEATAVKVFEAQRALADGAVELDMVINIGRAIEGAWDLVSDEIAAVVTTAHQGGAIVKVIFENCYLAPDQISRLCRICGERKADYIKTSTGFGSGGATHDDLILMRREAPPHVKLKAAGGVRDLDAVLEVLELGCDRVGTSRTAPILNELQQRLAHPEEAERRREARLNEQEIGY